MLLSRHTSNTAEVPLFKLFLLLLKSWTELSWSALILTGSITRKEVYMQ